MMQEEVTGSRGKKNSIRCTAIVVAAGSGKRMGADRPKQFLDLCGRPILYYPLKAFQDSGRINEIIIVTGPDLIDYIRKNIVEAYGLTKVSAIVRGGSERFESVYEGIRAAGETDYLFVQDGVRPFLNGQIIEDGYQAVRKYGTAVAGMPSKDTVKVTDGNGIVQSTPDRSSVWIVQTPQIFEYREIKAAYEKLFSHASKEERKKVTDDAMVMETYGDRKVHMYRASYSNIKITTPEDLPIAEELMKTAK
ncbi:MAG: 2-C-methyl-D-erythritol 4-phosphate cytidylyltransferase [Eubacterium sp.]|nr:2-C-methyl-D-erythritol 4-phosphate cytidylyltransferase [Eubacterium sp.]